MAKKRKDKPKDRLAGRSPDMQLYRAVRRYVESKGGNILVIGGIEIQEWPGEGPHKFRVAVRIMGKRPPPFRQLCPHGMVLAENVCGICSEGRPNRRSSRDTGEKRAD